MKTKLKIKQEKGITLIALVVTIVVLLILAGVSISLVLNNNGVISKAKDAKNSTEKGQAQDEVNLAINYLQIEDATSTLTREDRRKILEDELRKISADSSVSISGLGYKITHKKYDFFVDKDLKISSSGKTFDAVEWDKKAAPEDIFIWKSDDPNNADYGVIIGYTKNVDNYTILRFPSRCTKVTNDPNSDIYHDTEDDATTIRRSNTNNILKVELPDTVKELGVSAFSGNDFDGSFNFSSLERIELPKNISKIENSTFYDCKNLKYVKMPDNITEIGARAFYGCGALESITIPESIRKIGSQSFSGCKNLQKINLPEGLEKIEYGSFEYCTSLQQINLPEGIKSIGSYSFESCKNLQQINLPEGLEEIGYGSFESCTNLQQINLPEGLESIGESAFKSTNNLSVIIIPESVKIIGSWAFSGWTASQTIKCKATKAGDNWDKYWNYNYAYPASKATKISANIIWGYQDNNT